MFGLILLRRLHSTSKILGSALYLTGQRAAENYAYISPYIDCEKQFENIEELKRNIHSRKLDIDVESLKNSWEFLKTIKESKQQLEVRREETANKIKSLIKNKNETETAALKLLGKSLRDNLKTITKEIWDIEDNLMTQVLSLPNNLHPDTPLDKEIIITEIGDKTIITNKTDTGNELIKYVNPTCYYLENKAALFEIAMEQYITEYFCKKDYLLTSNSDFVKSLIVEGCGKIYTDKNYVYTIEDSSNTTESLLHLVGGSTTESFAALFSKHIINLTDTVLKLFTIGRQYNPSIINTDQNLYNVSQSTSSNIFILGPNNESQMYETFNDCINTLIDFYKQFGWHFRVVKCCANQLHQSESIKYSIEMYSNNLNKYIQVGYVSYCGTYISKRLLMKYNSCGNIDFLSTITGNIINIQKVLAILLENNKNNVDFPDCLKSILL